MFGRDDDIGDDTADTMTLSLMVYLWRQWRWRSDDDGLGINGVDDIVVDDVTDVVYQSKHCLLERAFSTKFIFCEN